MDLKSFLKELFVPRLINQVSTSSRGCVIEFKQPIKDVVDALKSADLDSIECDELDMRLLKHIIVREDTVKYIPDLVIWALGQPADIELSDSGSRETAHTAFSGLVMLRNIESHSGLGLWNFFENFYTKDHVVGRDSIRFSVRFSVRPSGDFYVYVPLLISNKLKTTLRKIFEEKLFKTRFTILDKIESCDSDVIADILERELDPAELREYFQGLLYFFLEQGKGYMAGPIINFAMGQVGIEAVMRGQGVNNILACIMQKIGVVVDGDVESKHLEQAVRTLQIEGADELIQNAQCFSKLLKMHQWILRVTSFPYIGEIEEIFKEAYTSMLDFARELFITETVASQYPYFTWLASGELTRALANVCKSFNV